MNGSMLLLADIFLKLGIAGALISIFLFFIRKYNTLLKVISAVSLIVLLFDIGCIIFLLFSSKPSVAMEEIVKTGVSKDIMPGKVIMKKDKKLQDRDYDIVIDSKLNSINISIWDFAAEDGDYVELISGGKAIEEAFMLKNTVKTIRVPVTGSIEIKGVKDGGGGITYALYVKETGETYFNDAPDGGFNTYTIKKKK